MAREWGQTVDAILDLLKECGPMSPAEIAMELGLDRMNVSTIMTRMRKPLKNKPKRITIIRYVYDNEGQRRYPRPVYAIGAGVDVKRPKSNPKENKRRYLQGLRTKMTANSVFNLAMTRKQYMELKRGKIEEARAC